MKPGPKPRSVSERFWPKVDFWAVQPNGWHCWEWTASKDASGYGRFDKSLRAHRVAYELKAGPIPDGLDLDHLCRNRACVRPDHLEPVTRSENLRRSPLMGVGHTSMTHCKRGHEFSDENTYHSSAGKRHCRTCRADWARAHRTKVTEGERNG